VSSFPFSNSIPSWLLCADKRDRDTGQYAIKFDAVNLEDLSPAKNANNVAPSDSKELVPIHHGITLDQRAVLLATAMTLDVDYFSRHSGSGGSVLCSCDTVTMLSRYTI